MSALEDGTGSIEQLAEYRRELSDHLRQASQWLLEATQRHHDVIAEILRVDGELKHRGIKNEWFLPEVQMPDHLAGEPSSPQLHIVE